MLHHAYDWRLVLASMLVASLAGYAALDLSTQVATARGWSRVRWTIASAAAMGTGIWSMHFVGMLALSIGVPVFYDIPLVFASAFIAMAASAITFLGASGGVSTGRLLLASFAMGPAIAGMHYTGMAAMHMPARIEYRPALVAFSILVAIGASFAALLLSRHFRGVPSGGASNGTPLKLAASVVMGAAVYGMHYTGMLAARFAPADPVRSTTEGLIPTHELGWIIAAGACIVMGFAVLAGIANSRLGVAQRAAFKASRQQGELAQALQQVGRSLTAELDLQRIVQTVTDVATTMSGAQFGAFFYNLVDERGEAYTLYTISGVPREEFSKFPMPRNTPVFSPTFHGEGTVISDDIMADPRYGTMSPYKGMPAGHLPVRSYLAVSVVSRNGSVLGGLFFGHSGVGVFKREQAQIVEGIAAWAAVAMDNASLFEAEQRARAEAERASRAKGDFLAVMSHELRTPLNAVIGYADLLLMGVDRDPAEVKRKLERIGFSAKHLLQLIDEILTFSRLEANEERAELAPMDPATVMKEVEAMMEPIAQGKGIELVCTVPDVPLGIVQGDARKVRQILVNLVANAIKFTRDGRVSLSLGTDGGAVTYRVRDTGVGIASEHLDSVFNAFWRVENTSTRGTSGSGLGLSVSRSLARLLGGDVTVESTLGEGSTFTVRLPAR